MTVLAAKKLGRLREDLNHFHEHSKHPLSDIFERATKLVALPLLAALPFVAIYKCTGSTARYTPIDSSQFGMLVQVIVVHGFVI
jgi:hypothetical protein